MEKDDKSEKMIMSSIFWLCLLLYILSQSGFTSVVI